MSAGFLSGATLRFKLDQHILPICAACSVALHSVLFTVQVAPEPARVTARAGGGPRVVHIRLQLPPSITGPIAVIEPQPDSRQPTATVQPTAAIPRPVSPEAEKGTDVSEAVTQALSADAAQDALSMDASSANAFAQGNEFVPRPLLSVPPTARMPIVFPMPLEDTDVARYLGVLSLFIDEEGRVQYISVDGPLLPPALEQAAREAFMHAQFWPGQVDGRAVKSRQRVEVVFDNTPVSVH